ncbi:MAG: CpaF family protein [Desulfosarcinaceae bacterium]|nr:CpaF family protein [Desulfosarcinaceae bacterium]
MQQQFNTTVRSFLTPILPYLDDPDVSEIMINNHEEIWIERSGRVQPTEAHFDSSDALMSAVNNISQFVQRRIDDAHPTMDARLPDGSRIHVILPPCARKGICISIRKFAKEALTTERLLSFGSLDQSCLTLIQTAVALKKNIMVSGGTGSGKTSLLNALSSLIANSERIVVIEDSAELQLQQDHVLLLEARMADRFGKGAVTIRDLLHSTLRLRPDRIIIGEIRGGEALDLLQAMNTGHGGSMGTIHANTPMDALSRLETLALYAGVDLPLRVIRAQVAAAIELVVQTARYSDGSRKISHISEVLPLDGDGNYQTADIFYYKREGIDAHQRILGHHEATGLRPSFLAEAAQSEHALPASLFGNG